MSLEKYLEEFNRELEKMSKECDENLTNSKISEVTEEIIKYKELDDIPEVKIGLFEKVKNYISRKKEERKLNKQMKEELNFVDSDDIPEVTETRREKLVNWFTSKKDKHLANKEIRKQQKDFNKTKKQMNKIEKSVNKETKQDLNKESKSSYMKSIATAVLFGTLTVVSISGALIAAAAVSALGLLPTLGITSFYVTAGLVSRYMFNNEVRKIKEAKENQNIEVENEPVKEEKTKTTFKQKLEKTKQNLTEKAQTAKANYQQRKEVKKQEKLDKKPERFAKKMKFLEKSNNILDIVSAIFNIVVCVISGASIGAIAATPVKFLPGLLISSVFAAACAISLCQIYSIIGSKVRIVNPETEEIIEEPIQKETTKEKVLEKQEAKVLKAKLSREEKVGQVKGLEIVHDSKLGIYCIPVDKEDKKLQRFIREEYKQEYPQEKIQSFETEDKKVLVLSKESKLFR